MEKMVLKTIGYVESTDIESIKKPSKDNIERFRSEINEYRRMISENICTIRILPEFEPLLSGLESFSHILVLFWPHKLTEEDRKIEKVHPMGCKNIEKKGVFATRSPARPNPVLITTVELLKIDGCVLKVKGLEAFKDTPVIDIKPETGREAEKIRVPDWLMS